MERCDGGQYMYLPSWRVIYTSRTVTIAVWGVGEGGEGGNHVSFSLSLLSSRFSSLSPSSHLLIFLLGNITIKNPKKRKEGNKVARPKIESPIQSVHVLHKVSNKATYLT